jgi:hypothetical protein
MNCAGSVTLIKALTLPESDEEDWRRDGIAAHEAAAHCLNNGLDAWEIIGEKFYTDVEFSEDMAKAIQVYLDECRRLIDQPPHLTTYWVEYSISSPVHPDFYGTLDFAAANPAGIRVRDYKHGEGIAVFPEENPQQMYYAFGLIDGHERTTGEALPDDMPVELGVVQPRTVWLEPVRTWTTTVGEIKAWVHDVLVPAMNATDFDHGLQAGSWCRFCPAKLACPLLTSLFRAAAMADNRQVVHLSDEALGRDYELREAVKFYLKAQDEEAFRRLQHGHDLGPGAKLVHKLARRVYHKGAESLARAKFGADAIEPARVKSPAELEKVSPAAAEFVKEYAFTPDTGLTVAPGSDRRQAVKVVTAAEMFSAALANLEDNK